MVVIFIFSGQSAAQSSGISGTITEKVIEIFVPDSSKLGSTEFQALFDSVHHLIRKCAHFCLFAALGFCGAMSVPAEALAEEKQRLVWKWLAVFVFGVMYAALDELHQLWSMGRSCQLSDVAIDALGVLAGLVAAWLIERLIIFAKSKSR